MYYYIFDPPTAAKEYERTAQIKETLSTLGIAGEMVSPTPGKSVSQLVEQAIAKRYSTIVAVGGITLINQVAGSLTSEDAVLGLIPLVNHPDILQLIGTVEWKVAAEQLKRRRWRPVHLGVIDEQVCFLTPASIAIPAHAAVSLRTPQFQAICSGEDLTFSLTPGEQLQVALRPEQKATPWYKRFGKADSLNMIHTHFQTEELTVETTEVLPITVAGSKIGSTPFQATMEATSIKLIVGRAPETA